MENLEISAKTVEEAIQQALEQLGVGREEVEVTVLSEGKPGIFGRGGEEARIRVRALASSPATEGSAAEAARNILDRLLAAMDINASVVLLDKPFIESGSAEEGTTPITFDIKGDDLGILIGRHGQTLSCLQYIVRIILSHQTKAWVPVIIDVEGYRQRRYQALRALAYRIAERVKVKRTPFALEPMPAYERRIVHLALADHPHVTTESTGEGDRRKVVISPKGKQPQIKPS